MNPEDLEWYNQEKGSFEHSVKDSSVLQQSQPKVTSITTSQVQSDSISNNTVALDAYYTNLTHNQEKQWDKFKSSSAEPCDTSSVGSQHLIRAAKNSIVASQYLQR